MSKIHIVLRQSPDWGSINLNDFRKQSREFCILMGRPPEQVNKSVDLWNKTFNHSFFEVRQKIKNLTLANLSSIENSIILNGKSEAIPSNFEEGFYIFIDDDDWLHPKIDNLLSNAAHNQQTKGFIWGSVSFGTLNTKIILLRKNNGFCYTNNYAISGSFLKYDTKNYFSVYQHGDANKVLEQHGAMIINEYWSITNKNPTSTVYLEKVLEQDYSSTNLIHAISDYLERYKQIESEIDLSLQWARPLMDGMEKIFLELL
jgi:hypothetical protein